METISKKNKIIIKRDREKVYVAVIAVPYAERAEQCLKDFKLLDEKMSQLEKEFNGAEIAVDID